MNSVNWRNLVNRIPPAIGAVFVFCLLVMMISEVAGMSAVELLIGVPEPTKLSREQIRGGLFAIDAAGVVIAAGVLIAWYRSWKSDSE